MLAVLDLERDALAVEAERLAAMVENGAPAVEVIDRATWSCVQRLQAIGMLQRVEGPARVLHRAPELAEAEGAEPAPEPAAERPLAA
jgi:hypothetical protein